MPPERSVGLPRVLGVVAICHGGVRNDQHVVQLRPDSALGSSLASSFGRKRCRPSDLIGPHPKHETNNWTITDPPAAPIGHRVFRLPCYAIGFGELTLKSFMGRHNTGTVVIWREQINPHAPKFRALSDPIHENMFPNSADASENVAWDSVPE
jgi:hypothetical protein